VVSAANRNIEVPASRKAAGTANCSAVVFAGATGSIQAMPPFRLPAPVRSILRSGFFTA
jgi:hypothetical protein